MSKLLIVYHSKTGGSRQMAEAAAVAAEKEFDTILKAAREAEPDDLLQSDGYIFCAPEDFAAIAGIMKDFFDRCYYPVLVRIEGRPMLKCSVRGPTAKTRRAKLRVLQKGGAFGKCSRLSSFALMLKRRRKFWQARRSRKINWLFVVILAQQLVRVSVWAFSDQKCRV